MKATKKVTLASKELTKTQFEILKSVADFLSVTEIARYRRKSHPSVSKTIKILLRKGFVEKIGRKYKVTEGGKKRLHSFIGFRYNLRQHNLHIKIKVLESLRNWDKKRNQIVLLPYFNKRVELKNNYYDLFNYGKLQIKTTSKSIIIKIPTIYSKTVDSAILQALDILFASVPKIESLFKIKLIKDYKCNITFITQEYARLEDALARLYRKEAKTLYITDENGEVRVLADYSFNVSELETPHPKHAGEDMNAISPFMLDLIENPTTFKEVRETVTEIMKVQQMQSYNIVKHQKVLDEMLITLKKIRENLK